VEIFISLNKIYVRYRTMPTKDPVRNRQYVAKSRAKAINTLGIEEYRKRMAQKQREYRAKRKILKNANISDRKGRNFDVNELVNIRKELKKERSKN
jgi:hypothetical protein